ncbi:MAG: transposase [Planctomycetota bacterium]|jgi:hypothetical protein
MVASSQTFGSALNFHPHVHALATLLGLDVRYEQDKDGTFRVRLQGAYAEAAG